jgi:hypothetical protein
MRLRRLPISHTAWQLQALRADPSKFAIAELILDLLPKVKAAEKHARATNTVSGFAARVGICWPDTGMEYSLSLPSQVPHRDRGYIHVPMRDSAPTTVTFYSYIEPGGPLTLTADEFAPVKDFRAAIGSLYHQKRVLEAAARQQQSAAHTMHHAARAIGDE